MTPHQHPRDCSQAWEQTRGLWAEGGRVSPKDLILQLLELPFASSDIDDQRVLLLLQLRPLLPDHNAQQLGLQALRQPGPVVRIPLR